MLLKKLKKGRKTALSRNIPWTERLSWESNIAGNDRVGPQEGCSWFSGAAMGVACLWERRGCLHSDAARGAKPAPGKYPPHPSADGQTTSVNHKVQITTSSNYNEVTVRKEAEGAAWPN